MRSAQRRQLFEFDSEGEGSTVDCYSSYGALKSLSARSAGSHISQFFDLLPFLGHQKIFYKTCMCAVKVALNFLPIRKSSYYELFGPALI